VHDHVEAVVRTVRSGNRTTIIRETRTSETMARMRKEFASSREGRYWSHPKTCALYEHEYGQDVSREKWKELADNVKKALGNFYRGPGYFDVLQVTRDGGEWLDVEDFASFRVEGVKVAVKLDLAHRRSSGRIAVRDWKTGAKKLAVHAPQLVQYSMYASDKWGVPVDEVELLLHNLQTDERLPFTATRADADALTETIVTGAEKMRALLVDGDAERNEALPEEEFPASGDARDCKWCQFQKLCPRWATPDGSADDDPFA